MSTFITLRDQELYVKFRVINEPDVNYLGVEWEMGDDVSKLVFWMLTRQQKLTTLEEEQIETTLIERGWDDYYDDYGIQL